MRAALTGLMMLMCAGNVQAQGAEKDVFRRFGIKLYEELYPQNTPKATLSSVLEVIAKDRYDYLIAHLLDPAFVDDQLRRTYPYFEKKVREQGEKEGWIKPGTLTPANKTRIAELATKANYDFLIEKIRTKLRDDPQSLKDLRLILSQGEFSDVGDTAQAKSKDVKDRQLFFRKIGTRWFLENRSTDK